MDSNENRKNDASYAEELDELSSRFSSRAFRLRRGRTKRAVRNTWRWGIGGHFGTIRIKNTDKNYKNLR